MNFLEAIKAMREGKKVTRIGKDNETVYAKEVYFYIELNRIKMHTAQNTVSEISPHCADFEATDWRVIFKPDKYYIYVCKTCKHQLSKEVMGFKCPNCEEWTYECDCRKEVNII